AGRARLGNDLARAMALRARLLNGEKSLRNAHLTLAVARRACFSLRPGLGAAAVTRRAFLQGGDANLGLGSACGFLERKLQVVAEIGAAKHAAAAPARSAGVAEYLSEDVAE